LSSTIASGSLTVVSPLDGSATDTTAATAQLNAAQALLTGTAASFSSAQALLTVQSQFFATAADMSTASGRLVAVSPIPWPSHILLTGHQSSGIAAIAGGLPYGEFFASVGDIIVFGIDWDGALAQYWRPGAIVPPGLVVRPTSPNGFEFATTLGGQFGGQEPNWVASSGVQITSGSVLLTAQPASTDSLAATVQRFTPTPPPGLTIDAQAIVGQMVIFALDATSAVSGQSYTVLVPTQMTDGETRTGRIVLKVR
jgi:hypothetical protein